MTRPELPMTVRTMVAALGTLVLTLATLQAAALSRQEAEAFQRKIDTIARNTPAARPTGRRTPVSETELNSWFAYRAKPLLPQGVADPAITIVGNGKVMGNVVVDLGAMSKQRSSGGTFDPFSYLGGRVPVTVTGMLQTDKGQGRFDLESADIGGLPVPKALLQEVVSYYSKTEKNPQGVRIDAPFQLPAGIQKIEVGQGQAVVVQ
jgi:hypothetical protein